METKELIREFLDEIGRLYDKGAKIQFDSIKYEKNLLIEKNEELQRKLENITKRKRKK